VIHDHLDPDMLDRILEQDRTEDQNLSLLHQIAVCPECRAVAGWLLGLHEAGLLPPRFGVVEVALARSRAEAPLLWRRLARHPRERRPALIQSSRRFASWGLCELLCRESRKAAAGDPGRAVDLAELAALVADMLQEDDPVEDRWLYQLRAHAWAHLGNALRARGDLRRAAEAFALADSWWDAGEAGTGDALGYGPDLLILKASLRSDQRRFDEALDLLDRAAGEGDPHLAGRALVKKGCILTDMEEPERAIEALRQAEEMVDLDRDPRLVLCIRHNILDNLSRVGRFEEARDLLPEIQKLSRLTGTRLDRIRLRWTEGRIAAGLGRTDRARRAFLAVRRAFLTRGLAFDAALVSLELAVLYLEEGKTSEVRALTGDLLEIFRSRDVHREALAALTVFHNAALLETATAELARELASFLTKARRNPEASWEP
jgi:tetratricopeptide (TPR) repeat protein